MEPDTMVDEGCALVRTMTGHGTRYDELLAQGMPHHMLRHAWIVTRGDAAEAERFVHDNFDQPESFWTAGAEGVVGAVQDDPQTRHSLLASPPTEAPPAAQTLLRARAGLAAPDAGCDRPPSAYRTAAGVSIAIAAVCIAIIGLARLQLIPLCVGARLAAAATGCHGPSGAWHAAAGVRARGGNNCRACRSSALGVAVVGLALRLL